MPQPFFSLLLATFNSREPVSTLYARWLSACRFPADVEFLAAMERGDRNQHERAAGWTALVTDPPDARSSAVLNWNSAASASIGAVLVVIADDLDPVRDWDVHLRRAIGTANPLRRRFVIKVNDSGDSGDSLVRHPIISRKHYADLGLFDPSFSSMYCDNDFTWRAFFRSQILDCRHLEFAHRNPSLGDFSETESHRRNNDRLEYEHGRLRFDTRWPKFIKPSGAKSLPLAQNLNSSLTTLSAARISILLNLLRQHLLGLFDRVRESNRSSSN
jgi:hypothetical protein